MAIKNNYLVKKRNILNEIRSNNMTIQELRFFSIYLSKINPKDINTRVVRFPISDFQKIMDFGKLNIAQLRMTTDSLLSKIVRIPIEVGGYTSFQLFKECTVSLDKNKEWYVEIDAHDKALPLMFEFKNRYFSYQLWNALCLKSANQLRMYEILKQYEKVGERVISVDELKELLGIDLKEYKRFSNFKNRVLDSCQEALKNHTDIKFTCEPTGKKGRGGKINYLKFTIKKNDSYTNQLSLEDFMDLENTSDDPDPASKKWIEKLAFFAQACDNEFSTAEIQVLYDLIIKILPPAALQEDTEIYDYYKRKYNELIHRAEQTKITHRFAYLKRIIASEII